MKDFRQKLGEGYFRLDLPQQVDRSKVDKVLDRYQAIRSLVAETPKIESGSPLEFIYLHSFSKDFISG